LRKIGSDPGKTATGIPFSSSQNSAKQQKQVYLSAPTVKNVPLKENSAAGCNETSSKKSALTSPSVISTLSYTITSKLVRSSSFMALSTLFMMIKTVGLLGADILRSTPLGVCVAYVGLLFSTQMVSNLEVLAIYETSIKGSS
jgi:hypothetical protein